MDKKTLSKILAVMLVITLTLANFLFLAVYAGKSYAASVNYEEQETSINKTDVNFDAYFVSETGEKTHTNVTEMNNSELKLFVSISVTKGYLKDAVVSIENANFKVVKGDTLPEGVEAVDVENNSATLKQINKGESKEIVLPIEVIKDEQFDLSNFSKEAKINLKGSFVNDAAKEIEVDKDILVNLSLSENAQAHLEGIVSKYVAFEEDGKQKELLQLKVSSNVVDNLLPIKTTEISVEIPTLYGLMPEYISAFSTSTKATNGQSDTYFEVDEYVYESGILELEVQNEADENNKVSWLKNATDEYIVNLVYDVDEIVEAGETGGREARPYSEVAENVKLNISSKLSLYNNEEKVIESEVNEEVELPEVTNSVVSFDINNEENEIAKGYMLVENAANTEYKQKIEVNIGYSPIVKNIEINKGSEYYTDSNEKNYTATTYYKKISINKENLVNILGEEGTIQIISGEELIATLNAETTEYIFEKELTEVKMVTSEPEAEGTLVIETEKYIKSAEYDAEIISTLNKMTTTIAEATEETELVEPTLQVTSSISNNKLSTVVENENVELRVALQTNNNTNRLFKDPTIEIELPSYIKEIEVKSINLLYDTELVATNGEIVTNSVGNKVIKIKLEGEQTKFSDVLSVEGMTLIIGTDLTVEKTTPSTTQEIKVRVINDGIEVVESSASVEYVAPTGMITLNSITGYNAKNETVTSMSGNLEIGKLDVKSESKTATQEITIINNYDYTCGNIQILGRTPTQGNKEIGTEKDLGSTFTAKMVSGIKVVEGIDEENITVYYSGNENATEDLTNTANGWTNNKEEVEIVKSYLIVLNKTMVKGDKISFNYDIEIPEGLSREQSTYTMYTVNYTNMDGALQGAEETAKSSIVGVSTGGGADLEVELVANVENGEKVKERQIIEYTAKVKNIGKVVANNIEVSVDIPEFTYYTEKQMDVDNEIYVTDGNMKTYTTTIDTIQPGETKEITFMLSAGIRVEITMEDIIDRDDYETQEEYEEALKDTSILDKYLKNESHSLTVKANAKVIEDGEEIIFTSNEITNEKVRAYFELYWETENTKNELGDYKSYRINVNKIGDSEINNLKITCPIPQGLKYVDTITDNADDITKQTISDDKVEWILDDPQGTNIIEVVFKIDDVKENTKVSVQMTGTCDEMDGEIKTEIDTFTIGTPKLEIAHSSTNTVGYLAEGDEITYILTVKNVSDVNAYGINITDYVSEGLNLKNIKYNSAGEIINLETSGTSVNMMADIPANETLTVEVTAKAKLLDENETTRAVTNRFEVEATGIEKIESSTITHTLNKRSYSIDDENNTVTRFSISGLAWIDANSNGIRELDEKTLPEIPVILLNESGNIISSGITGENGSYIFSNLAKGNYIVTFLYDMANYDVTLYQTGDVTTNNDAVIMKVNMEGIATDCAATNVISILTGNINNIDLGLVENPKFDLSLEKTVSKVVVQNSKGTTTNTYNNSKLEKIELPSNELNNSTVAIEYLITVKNNGAIAGYAKRVVDYLSGTDLKFSSETNPDWYLGTDGNLYNSTLANTLLQPGESATLKLVLTKNVTENNTGITNNTAEIYEAFNDEGIEDYNSTPANKASNENDLGQADIIIGPKTGVVLYVGIILVFMIIVTAGIYIINKKVIRKV